jgi:ApaG protein
MATKTKDYTNLITVEVEPHFVPEQSDPVHQKFVWSYTIKIVNGSEDILQLLHRYWRITDMTGKKEEVHGAGVVGLQPLMKPQQHFTYTSYCQLATPQGTMEGHYEFQNLEDKHFSIPIPKFDLLAPASISLMDRTKLH